jgi:hypothetical protein
LLVTTNYYSERFGVAEKAQAADAEAEGDDADDSQDADEEYSSIQGWREPEQQTSRAMLEQMAPMPRIASARSTDKLDGDTETAVLSALIAQAYEHTDNAERELPYLKLAAFLQKDETVRTGLRRRIDALNQAAALEARNALRRPVVQGELDQARAVRARLSVADLVREEAAQ